MLKLSPNEVDQLLEEERKKWRIFRIQQVRAQSKIEAGRISNLVKTTENQEKLNIKVALKQDWEGKRQEKLNILQTELEEAVSNYGGAHKNAMIEIDQMKVNEMELKKNEIKAKARGDQAMKLLMKEKKDKENNQKATIEKKKASLAIEKARARNIACRETPPKIRNQRIKKKPPVPSKVMLHQAGTFLTSSYVPKKPLVQKEGNNDQAMNAREAARKEMARQKEHDIAKAKKKRDDFEKVLDRGRDALRKERERQVRFNLEPDESSPEKIFSSGNSKIDAPGTSANSKKEQMGDCSQDTSSITKNFDSLHIFEHLDSSVQSSVETSDSDDIDFEKKVEDILVEPEDGSSKETSANYSPDTPQGTEEDMHLKETVPADRLDPNKISNPEDHAKMVPSSKVQEVHDIHLKETVPADQITNDQKFLRSIHTQGPNGGNQHRNVKESGTQVDFSDSSGETLEYTSIEEMFLSYATEYKKLPEPQSLSFLKTLRDNLEKYSGESSLSSSATEYKSLPSTTDHELEEKLKIVQDNTKTVQKLLNSLKPKPVLSTPTNVYIKPVKMEGSGKKMLSKRQKFEETKKLLIKQYTDSLMAKRQHEIENMSASTVGASGLTLPSPSSLSTPSITSRESPKEFSRSMFKHHSTPLDLDQIPVRLRATEKTSSSSVPSTTASSLLSSNSAEKEKLQGILEKVEKLALIKQQLLAKIQEAQEIADGSSSSSVISTLLDSLNTQLTQSPSLHSSASSSNHTLTGSSKNSSKLTPHSSVCSTTLSSTNAPSSSSSEPELRELLERFGLEWAQTMIKQMDRADKRASSGSSLH